jgi:lipid-A-disaccharide synthase
MVEGDSAIFRLMIVAGEPSGDAHAAALVRALRKEAPEAAWDFFGATGPLMREAGVETIVHSDDLAIMGLAEITGALPAFWRAFQALKRAGVERRPEAVVLVDWPDFNLRLARTFHRQGLRVIYYISPQLWAWRSRRVRSIRRDVDLLLTILPFESEWYKERGFDRVEYVGHPLAGEVRPQHDREEFCRRESLDPSLPLIALLPGSRRKELERILPPMLEAMNVMARERASVQFVLALAPNRSRAEAEAHLEAARRNNPDTPAPRIVHDKTREALGAAAAAAVASGTATLEAALLNTPFVIVYKESFINWHTLGRLINVEHFGLVNLIAGERLVTELMQNELTGERLAVELIQLLDREHNEAARAQLREVSARLGSGGASQRAASAILTRLLDWQTNESSEKKGAQRD